MATVDELLSANGIVLKSTGPGRHYTTCPQCSHTRKGSHRKKPCLGVTIDAKGATWGCNHCSWTGPEKGNGSDAGGKWTKEGEWVYHDADDKPYLKVIRYRTPDGEKTYPQYHIEGVQWVKGKPQGPKIPYRLPELLDSDRTEPVWVFEGEKCADIARRHGLQATSASEGAGKWTADLNEYFADRIVGIVPDADQQGRDHAAKVAIHLHGVAKEVRIIDLPVSDDRKPVAVDNDGETIDVPSIKAGEDIEQFFTGGGTAEHLLLLSEAAPIWNPLQNGINQGAEGLRETRQPEPVQLELSLPLTLDEWATRKLPVADFISGDWLTTTSRTLLVAPTGIGKTMFALALAFSVALGRGFLQWRAQRPVRVLFIDGEMSRRLLQERLIGEEKRWNARPSTLYALSHEDIEDFAPLNTPKGQAQVEAVISKIGGVDLIVFDNIMSLTTGDMKDEESWRETLPWLKRLTARMVGQIWIHHTGHDQTKSYGTKTREWQMDTVIILETVENLLTDVSFMLRFDKARERTPTTRADFSEQHVTLVDDKWSSQQEKPVAKKKISPLGAKFLDALRDATVGSNQPKMHGWPTASIDQWKAMCVAKSLIDREKPGRNQSVLFAKYKRELISCNSITCNETMAWTIT
jgi:hypothetical protein